ncbi:hypothetical protein AB0D13_23595 [Streptomyces sp. NPDC048430]|uniref:hypothetical protein n=1 Tax=Streptomyces sp. NPDC048430 TaxID=3155388 RepID=UPI003437B512
MGVSQSNLSDYTRFGFDLVVAVTQASVNATLKQLLAGLNAPEVILCYVYEANNDIVPIDYLKLVENAKGSDPFVVPEGANPQTDQRLVNLTNAHFAGAVKARLGLPDLPLASLPAIATLGNGSSAPVLFNLMCAEFQIAGFDYGPGGATWINKSQPSGSGSPWYFSAIVRLNTSALPPEPDPSMPPAVLERIRDLQKMPNANAFTIQKLFLDLDTAFPMSVPIIKGIRPGWAVWQLISTFFFGAYFDQLRKNGDPVLGFSFVIKAPRPTTLQLGSVSPECSPLLGPDGKPIDNPTPAELNAKTLVYIGSQSSTAPVPVGFPWNWVDLGDVTKYAGVQAVRRDCFFTYFAGLLNPEVSDLCLDTHVEMSHSGWNLYYNYGVTHSSLPVAFGLLPQIGAPGPDGFTDVLSLFFRNPSHDSSENSIDALAISGDFNFQLGGTVAVQGNQIRVRVQAVAYMSFQHREYAFSYNDLEGKNYYDKTLTVMYTMGVDQSGALQVTETHNVTDNSSPLDFTPGGLRGLFGGEDDIKDALTAVESNLAVAIDSSFTGFLGRMTDAINGYRAWVFPGNDAFVFKNLTFSNGLDLTAQLTYVSPEMDVTLAPGMAIS